MTTSAFLNSWRPILLATISIVCTALGATWYLSAQMHEYVTRLEVVEHDKYTMTMASERALRMALANPNMRVPDPRDPTKIITVLLP